MKLFAIDLDGTLLDSSNSIHDESRAAIREAILRNYFVTIATGRISGSAILYARFLGIQTPLICLDGADIVHPVSGATICQFPIENFLMEQVIGIAENYSVPYFLYSHSFLIGKSYSNFTDNWREKRIVRPHGFPERNQSQLQYVLVQTSDKAEQNIEEPILKVSLHCPTELIFNELSQVLNKIKGISVKPAPPFQIDVTSCGIHKLSGLSLLSDILNVPLKEIVAFGNSYNDIEMLCGVGKGVAVANAPASIRKCVPYETLSNDEHGVAHAILSIIREETNLSLTNQYISCQ